MRDTFFLFFGAGSSRPWRTDLARFAFLTFKSAKVGWPISWLHQPASRRKPAIKSRVAISTVSDPSGSGRVDMLTGPVAAARAVAAAAWVKSKHDETRHVSDTWKCGSLSFIFTHPPED